MKKRDLLLRIERLEAQVAALMRDRVAMQLVGPVQPVYPPAGTRWPGCLPEPVWPDPQPSFPGQPPIITFRQS